MVVCTNSGIVTSQMSVYKVCYHLNLFEFLDSPCSSSTHRGLGKKATVTLQKFLKRPGRESNSRLTSTEADAFTTMSRAGQRWQKSYFQTTTYSCSTIFSSGSGSVIFSNLRIRLLFKLQPIASIKPKLSNICHLNQ